MTSSNDHTDDGTKLAQDRNEPDDPDMTFVTQAHYERESHRDLDHRNHLRDRGCRGRRAAEIKDPPLYECVDIAAIEDGFFGPRSTVTHVIVRGVFPSDIISITLRLPVMGGLLCPSLLLKEMARFRRIVILSHLFPIIGK